MVTVDTVQVFFGTGGHDMPAIVASSNGTESVIYGEEQLGLGCPPANAPVSKRRRLPTTLPRSAPRHAGRSPAAPRKTPAALAPTARPTAWARSSRSPAAGRIEGGRDVAAQHGRCLELDRAQGQLGGWQRHERCSWVHPELVEQGHDRLHHLHASLR